MSRSYWVQILEIGRRLKTIWNPSRQPRLQDGINKSHSQGKKWDGGRQQYEKQKISALQRIADQENARYQEEKAANQSTGRWERRRFWLDACAVIAVISAALYARQQVISMQNQQKIMADQLAQMQADSRPWVSIQATIKRFSISDFDGTPNVSFTLQYTLRNYGTAPARNIVIVPNILPRSIGGEQFPLLDTAQNWQCDAAEKQSRRAHGYGITIFPGQTANLPGGISAAGLKLNGLEYLAVQGCVDYTYGGDTHGKAAYRLMVGRKDEFGRNMPMQSPFQLGVSPKAIDRKLPPVDVPAAAYSWAQDDAGGNYVK